LPTPSADDLRHLIASAVSVREEGVGVVNEELEFGGRNTDRVARAVDEEAETLHPVC